MGLLQKEILWRWQRGDATGFYVGCFDGAKLGTHVSVDLVPHRGPQGQAQAARELVFARHLSSPENS